MFFIFDITFKEFNKKDIALTPDEFRKFKNGHLKSNKNKSYGIPQGSPISSILSNIYMIEFDKEMNDSMQAITDISFKNSDAMRKQLFDTTYKLEEKVDSLTQQNENKLEAMRLTLENKITALQEDNSKKL